MANLCTSSVIRIYQVRIYVILYSDDNSITLFSSRRNSLLRQFTKTQNDKLREFTYGIQMLNYHVGGAPPIDVGWYGLRGSRN